MKVDINLADILKLPIKILASIALGTGLILFLPNDIIDKLFLKSFRKSFGFIIGIVFIISISIVSVSIVIAIFQVVSKKIIFSKTKKSRERCLNNLDVYQKTIVYDLYSKLNHTDELPLNDGAVKWLEQNMIIGKATNQHFIENLLNPAFPYLLQPWVINYLNEHTELVEELKKSTEELGIPMKTNGDNYLGYW